MIITTIGIIGAGQMGRGIAQVAAQAGYNVIMQDIKAAALDMAVEHIKTGLEKMVAKGRLAEADRESTLSRLKTTTDTADFAEADVVIEAATENLDLKLQLLRGLLPHLKSSAIICSNTSSISITRLAAATDRPDRFMGMHFMNPVPVMQLVELIRGLATEDSTFDAIKTLAERMGKTVAVSQDFPGFIVNRILMPMINEAITALHEGVGDVASIDMGMKLGTNQPMGPLLLADFIGLDTCLAIMQVLYTGMSDSKYRPSPLLVKYVEAGWLGRKTGRGFYDYSADPPRPLR